MAMDEDMSVFMDTDDFADEVVINDQPFSAIFDNAEVVEGEMLVTRPTLMMATDDTAGLVESDSVVVGVKQFTYDYQTDDGTGMSLVVLKDA